MTSRNRCVGNFAQRSPRLYRATDAVPPSRALRETFFAASTYFYYSRFNCSRTFAPLDDVEYIAARARFLTRHT